MKKFLTASAILAVAFTATAKLSPSADSHGYPINPVSFTKVKVTDSFWGQRLKASRETTIPLAFGKCEESGRYENFRKAANPSDDYKVEGFSFDDTDVYKTIEGASYLLQTYPDKRLENYIDSVLAIVAAAQEPDGYLNTCRTMNPRHPHPWAGSRRWEKVEELSHEFYNLGHMVEGAIAHYQATGKRNFLDIAIRYADCVCREIGDGPGQVCRVPGHQIAEMALARLYLVTGEKKYLDQARYFLDKRGHTSRTDSYSQAHKPVTEQNEAVGHAVRAAYMYAGMADVAALTGDSAYIKAIDHIWENITRKKYYITGGIGATRHGEAFGANYELPNHTAYCETCAAIGNVYVNHRLFLLHGESKYYDVLERTLYNGLISGVALDGGSFFYPNPLASYGDHERKPWFGCACCPSNISRFIPSIPGYVYASEGDNLYVNLFMSNSADLNVGGKDVTLTQTASYPLDGHIYLSIGKNSKGAFSLKLRIPGWVRNNPVPGDLYSYIDGKTPGFSVMLNGKSADGELTADGYYTISRKWKKGDRVELHLDMEPRIVKARDEVEADNKLVAIERGPLVYCAEGAVTNHSGSPYPAAGNPNEGNGFFTAAGDGRSESADAFENDFDIHSVIVPAHPEISATLRPDRFNGIVELAIPVQVMDTDADGRISLSDNTLTLIPYYAWSHRGRSYMSVWMKTASRLFSSR